MTGLAETLESLRMADGRPDAAARRVELDGLKDVLTNHEIRRLRGQLNNITLQTDICGRLPADILVIMADHLDLEDVMRVRSVSRTWHEIFSTPEFCLEVIKKHFPSVWVRLYKSLDAAGQDAAKTSLSKWLPGAAADRIRRHNGRYHSMSVYHYNYERAKRMPRQLQIERQYNNGRVAFRMHHYGLITRDLRTGVLTEFLDENRASIVDWFLSNQYLISSNVSPNTLSAWPLSPAIDSETSYNVRLPSRVLRISGQGKQVGIVTQAGEVFIWNIGKLIKFLDTSTVQENLTNFKPLQIAIIFHPEDDGHFFIVYEGNHDVNDPATNASKSLRIVIQEYFDGTLRATYHSILFPPTSRLRDQAPTLNGRIIICTVLDADLRYTMVSAPHYDQGSRCQHACNTDSQTRFPLQHIVLVTFDIWTKKFAFQTHHLPVASETGTKENSGHKLDMKGVFIWNEQTILPVFRTEYSVESKPKDVENMLLLAVNSCNRVSNKSKRIPWYGRGDTDDKKIWFMPDEHFSLSHAAWCWIGGNYFARKSLCDLATKSSDDDPLVQVRGDDDFVVIFVKDCGMVVLCFDKTVRLPLSWIEADPSLPESLKCRHPFEGAL